VARLQCFPDTSGGSKPCFALTFCPVLSTSPFLAFFVKLHRDLTPLVVKLLRYLSASLKRLFRSRRLRFPPIAIQFQCDRNRPPKLDLLICAVYPSIPFRTLHGIAQTRMASSHRGVFSILARGPRLFSLFTSVSLGHPLSITFVDGPPSRAESTLVVPPLAFLPFPSSKLLCGQLALLVISLGFYYAPNPSPLLRSLFSLFLPPRFASIHSFHLPKHSSDGLARPP